MKNILVVDDEEDLLFTIKYGFEKFKNEYNINTAKNGQECLNILKKDIPNLILLDLMMPNMNGWEVFDKLKANQKYKKIPVIFLTARSDGLAADAGSMIADDYIEKPVDIDELESRIGNVLKKNKK